MTSGPYAFSYPDLMNQALAAGYQKNDLKKLRSAYEFGVRLFDGFYRAQYVPFINHLTRTASITISERASVNTVIMALLHSAYLFGQFRDGRIGGCSQAHRREVTETVGDSVEKLIFLYEPKKVHPVTTLRQHIESWKSYPDEIRQVLFVRIANELEDYLDYGMAYRKPYPMRDRIKSESALMLDLTRLMGHPKLANDLEQAYNDSMNIKLPDEVLVNHRDAFELPQHRDIRRGRLWTLLANLKKSVLKGGKIEP